jgi:hypothetical protein
MTPCSLDGGYERSEQVLHPPQGNVSTEVFEENETIKISLPRRKSKFSPQ